MSTIERVDMISTLADHGSAEVTVHHIAHGSTEHGWGHAYFRSYCTQCGWIGHREGYSSAHAAQIMSVRHINTDPHDPEGANRWFEDRRIVGYNGEGQVREGVRHGLV